MDKEEKIRDQKDTLKSIRENINMNRSEFSRYMDIPIRTLEEWEAGRRKMPDYVLRLLAYYVAIEQGIKEGRVIIEEKDDTFKRRNGDN